MLLPKYSEFSLIIELDIFGIFRSDTSISPFEAFYLLTLGGAKALKLEDRIGRIAPGYEADLTILDMKSTDIIRHRIQNVDSLSDVLFAQIVLADDRAVRAVVANGKIIYEKSRGDNRKGNNQ